MAKRGPKVKHPNALAMQKKIDAYFNGGAYKRKVITNLGEEVETPTPTISDLCLYLGFTSRQSFYDYEKREGYTDIIRRARLMIEREYEMKLHGPNPTGAIFALKNFGWSDKQEVEAKMELHIKVTHTDIEERLACLSEN